MKHLDQMIDAAIDGHFTETVFDESRYSALENKFAKYLAASETSFKKNMIEKNKIKTLISDISHQTKTPVSNIMLYSELLQEQHLPEEALQYTSALIVQAEKLKFLIDSLIKLSRLETGILTLSPKKTLIFPMLETLVEQYSPIAKEKNLSLILLKPNLDYNATGPLAENQTAEKNVIKQPAAMFDKKWTQEAIGNILDNAIKYTDKGSISLSVKSYEFFTCIKIADTGIGISEVEQAKIFSRFYRSETVREKPGIGIGLFLTREIISIEGGYIKVSSEMKKGSTFSVYLANM